MTESADPVAPASEQPTAPRTLEGSLNGSLMDELRQMVEQRVTPLVNPEPEPVASDLSEVEREHYVEQQDRYRSELEALSLENELLQLGRQYPAEVAILQRLFGTENDVGAWVQTLHEALNPAPREPEQEVSDVDRNNPASSPYSSLLNRAERDLIHLPDGSVITVEEGEAILRSARSLHG